MKTATRAILRTRFERLGANIQRCQSTIAKEIEASDEAAPYNRPMGLGVNGTPNHRCPYATGEEQKVSNFAPKRVLILSKTTRWEVITKKGLRSHNDHTLLQKHNQQLTYIDAITDVLKSRGIESKVVKANTYTSEAVHGSDLIISAGGDGTFLTAASLVRDDTPVIGINTDPVGSEGHLCLTGKERRDVKDVLGTFLAGQFRFFPRQRIRVTLLKNSTFGLGASPSRDEGIQDESNPQTHAKFNSDDEDGAYNHEIAEPWLALNEVFVGESHAARVSYLEIQFDDGPIYKQKNSGVIVCTGTGSTSWHYNINRLTEQNFSDILSKMKEMGHRVEGPMNESDVEELCRQYNERLVFAPDEKKMMYSIRDPVFNCTYPRIPTLGTPHRIRIKSKCSNAHLTLDGSTSIPFNHGAEVLIELNAEDALRTAILMGPLNDSVN